MQILQELPLNLKFNESHISHQTDRPCNVRELAITKMKNKGKGKVFCGEEICMILQFILSMTCHFLLPIFTF